MPFSPMMSRSLSISSASSTASARASRKHRELLPASFPADAPKLFSQAFLIHPTRKCRGDCSPKFPHRATRLHRGLSPPQPRAMRREAPQSSWHHSESHTLRSRCLRATRAFPQAKLPSSPAARNILVSSNTVLARSSPSPSAPASPLDAFRSSMESPSIWKPADPDDRRPVLASQRMPSSKPALSARRDRPWRFRARRYDDFGGGEFAHLRDEAECHGRLAVSASKSSKLAMWGSLITAMSRRAPAAPPRPFNPPSAAAGARSVSSPRPRRARPAIQLGTTPRTGNPVASEHADPRLQKLDVALNLLMTYLSRAPCPLRKGSKGPDHMGEDPARVDVGHQDDGARRWRAPAILTNIRIGQIDFRGTPRPLDDEKAASAPKVAQAAATWPREIPSCGNNPSRRASGTASPSGSPGIGHRSRV